jgi:hypothetical protein
MHDMAPTRTGLWLSLLCYLITARAQSFTSKAIAQSSPLAGAINMLTVTFETDSDLSASAGSAITISGLAGALMTPAARTSIPLVGGSDLQVFSDGVLNIKKRGAWDPAGALTLTITDGQTMAAGTAYTFSFQITNPLTSMSSPMVNISASGSASIAPTAMMKPGTPIHGVVEGADPLTVAVPLFNIRAIGQSTPVPGAVNTITVTLEATYDMQEGSSVTIAGLTGSQTADASSLSVTSTDGRLGTKGEWSQSQGRLVLRAASVGTTAGTACIVTFALTNPASPQPSPPVSVEATVALLNTFIGQVPPAAMADAEGFRRPLLTMLAKFEVLQVEQKSCLTLSSNQLNIAFRLGFDLPVHSRVTLHGLHGVQEREGSRLPLRSTALHLSGVDYAVFSGSAATMETQGMVPAGTMVDLSITLRNGPAEKDSPAPLSVSLVVKLGQNMSDVEVPPTEAETPSDQLLLGIPTCKRPLVMVEPRITSSLIYQSNPLALASNTFTVNFEVNVQMTRGSVISIIGLQDTCSSKSGDVVLHAESLSAQQQLKLDATWYKMAGQQYAIRVEVSRACCPSTAFAFSFQLVNCNYDRAHSPVFIAGFVGAVATVGHRSAYNSFFNGGEMVEMSVMKEPRQGVEGGALPLLVVVPKLTVKSMAQSNPLAGLSNTLTVTLASSVDVTPASLLTLRGVRGIVAQATLSASSVPAGSFLDRASYYSLLEQQSLIVQVGNSGLRY